MAMFPCAHMHLLADDAQRNAMLQAMLAFLTVRPTKEMTCR